MDDELEPSLGRVWEIGQGEEQVVEVQGRLRKCIEFWEEELKATAPVLECIREGYKLPMLSLLGVYYKGNHKSALDNDEFVSTAIEELVQNRW